MIAIPHPSLYRPLVAQALEEDVSHGDITTELTLPSDLSGRGVIVAKEHGVVAGTFVACEVFHQVDPSLEFMPGAEEGEVVGPSKVICEIEGSVASILAGERVALNFMQHMMGIATKAHQYIEAVKGLACRVVDTRKTTPGLRLLEKYAVRAGGAHNHRFNLSDGILIKDNHIAACGAVGKAVERAKLDAPHTLLVEVEVTNLEELQEAIEAGADAVLLDNMNIDQLREAVALVRSRRPEVKVEASGGITLENIRQVAETGVDIVSSGALTHSVKAVDLSLEITNHT